VVATQAPYAAEDSTYYWYDATVSKKSSRINNKQLTKSTKQLKDLINKLADKHDIGEDQIIAAGYSQGGTISYELAIKHKGLVHNMAIFSGMLTDEYP